MIVVVAGHEEAVVRDGLVVALDVLERRCRADNQMLPLPLAEFRKCLIRVRKVQEGAALGDPGGGADDPVEMHALLPSRLALTAAEVADLFGVSEATVKRVIRSGALPSVLIGGSRRVLTADAHAYLAALRGDDTKEGAA